MLEKRNIVIVALLAVISIVTLKEFGAHIKLAVGLSLASITAITLSDWSAIITILWGLLQIGLLIPGYYDLIFKKKNGT